MNCVQEQLINDETTKITIVQKTQKLNQNF